MIIIMCSREYFMNEFSVQIVSAASPRLSTSMLMEDEFNMNCQEKRYSTDALHSVLCCVCLLYCTVHSTVRGKCCSRERVAVPSPGHSPPATWCPRVHLLHCTTLLNTDYSVSRLRALLLISCLMMNYSDDLYKIFFCLWFILPDFIVFQLLC